MGNVFISSIQIQLLVCSHGGQKGPRKKRAGRKLKRGKQRPRSPSPSKPARRKRRVRTPSAKEKKETNPVGDEDADPHTTTQGTVENIFGDMGGTFGSVNVSWFNVSPWTKQFENPKNTYFVVMCIWSEPFERVHHMQILGDRTCFTFNDAKLTEAQNLWVGHQRPVKPFYRLAFSDGIDQIVISSDSDEDGPKDHKKPKYQGNMDHVRMDLTAIRDEIFRRAANLAKTNRVHEVYKELFMKVTNQLTSARRPYTWAENSCHLDTWLMQMIAVCSLIASTGSGGTLLLDTVRTDNAFRRLTTVLLSAGERNQNQLRDAYWLTEVEVYRAPIQMFRFTLDDEHDTIIEENSDAFGDKRTSVGVAYEFHCTNPDHEMYEGNENMKMYLRDKWFSIPDLWCREQDEQNNWSLAGTTVQHEHHSIEDFLQTVVCRSDLEDFPCKKCHSLGFFRISKKKIPAKALLPKVLRIGTEEGAVTKPQSDHFVIGGIRYELMGITFGNSIHFNGCIRLDKKWYQYDGMGVASGQLQNARGTHRLQLIQRRAGDTAPDAEFQAALQPFNNKPGKTPYKTLSYRYLRMPPLNGVHTWDRVHPRNCDNMPIGDLQFDAMNFVLDHDD